MLTQDRLRELFHYDPLTGVLTRRVSVSSNAQAGDITGTVDGKGYLQVMIDRKNYRVHRLAWLYVHGIFPDNSIDHINGDTSDNRIINLRDVLQSENGKNQTMPKTNKSGIMGVRWYRQRGKWHAQICVNRKRIHLGYYEDLELAALVRQEAELKYGFHLNHGRAA